MEDDDDRVAVTGLAWEGEHVTTWDMLGHTERFNTNTKAMCLENDHNQPASQPACQIYYSLKENN